VPRRWVHPLAHAHPDEDSHVRRRRRRRLRRGPGARGPPGPFRPHGRLDDRRAGRRRLDHRLPQRHPPRPATRPARRGRPPTRVHGPHHVLAPQRPPPPARLRRDRVPPRLRPAAAALHGHRTARDAGPGRASAGGPAAPGRLVRGGRGRQRAARLGHRVPERRRARGLRPHDPPARGEARIAHATAGSELRAGLAHVRAGRRAVGRARGRAADAPGALAGLRHRDRPLHPAAPRRPGRADLRDRDHDPARAAPARLHAGLRDRHAAGDGRRPGTAARVRRRAQRSDGAHRPR
jgi:hypothetical protein